MVQKPLSIIRNVLVRTINATSFMLRYRHSSRSNDRASLKKRRQVDALGVIKFISKIYQDFFIKFPSSKRKYRSYVPAFKSKKMRKVK